MNKEDISLLANARAGSYTKLICYPTCPYRLSLGAGFFIPRV